MGFDFEGAYTKVVEHELIEYVMDDERSVLITFIPVNGGIRVVETFDAEAENSAEQQRNGWQCILNNFAKHT